jgi:hypothetical protein
MYCGKYRILRSKTIDRPWLKKRDYQKVSFGVLKQIGWASKLIRKIVDKRLTRCPSAESGQKLMRTVRQKI